MLEFQQSTINNNESDETSFPRILCSCVRGSDLSLTLAPIKVNFHRIMRFHFTNFALLEPPKSKLATQQNCQMLQRNRRATKNVRISHMEFSLSFSIGTYMGRYRRHALDYNNPGEVSETAVNLAIAERQIVREFGPKACIVEEPCRHQAMRKSRRGTQPDWNNILR